MIASDDLKKEMFSRLITEVLYEETIDSPGNMTYFLRFTYKGEECNLKWGGQKDPSEKLLKYYNDLSRQITTQSPTM